MNQGKPRKPPTRSRRTAFVAVFLLGGVIPILLLGLFEATLAISGVKPLAIAEDSHFGFDDAPPLYLLRETPDGTDILETNPARLTHFNPQSFPARKAPGTYRIFALGGSTTYGHPWRDTTSFSAWLRELLPEADSGRHFEVINSGGISYASYRVARLVEELIEYEPDLFLVYNGHNEFLEERTYRDFRARAAWIRRLSASLEHTRVYSVIRRSLRHAESRDRMPAEVRDVLAHTIGPSSYTRDDALRRDILNHYEEAQKRTALLAASVGAQTIFITTPSNEADCSPFKSEPTPGLSSAEHRRVAEWQQAAKTLLESRPQEARVLLDSAVALDPRNADVLYLAGQAATSAGRHEDARAFYIRALEEDVCPVRAFPDLWEIERRAARETGSGFVDFVHTLEETTRKRNGHVVLGEPDFVDHVHLSIENYGRLAADIISEMGRMGILSGDGELSKASRQRASETILARLTPSEEALGFHNIAKVFNWAGKTEDAVRAARRGLELDTSSLESIWSSLFIGADLERRGLTDQAVPHYERALRLDPGNAETLRLLGDALLRIGDSARAEAHLESAALYAPEDLRLRERAGRLAYARKRYPDAVRHLRPLSASGRITDDTHLMLAGALVASGNIREAEAELRSLTTKSPGFAEAWMALGFVMEIHGRNQDARRYYQRTLELDPDLVPARRALMNLQSGAP